MRILPILMAICMAFTAKAQTGPGGVGSSAQNVLWLDANSGVTHLLGLVTQWNDRSGNANHAYLPGAIPLATPSLQTGSANGYPSLTFDGVVDQLWVLDDNTLDLTSWHFFIVVKANLQKDYNAWLVKGDDDDENYEMLSYSDGNIHTPIRFTNNTRSYSSTAAGQVTTSAFNIIEYSYSSGVGRDVYKNGTNVATDNDNRTPRVNTRPLYIGNERSTLGRNANADIAEVIAFNAPLNSAQRIIVNNYLAAKYGRTLTAGDVYDQDDLTNGNYDHDVAGIGRVDASNTQTESLGSGVVRIGKSTYGGLGNNEFLFWGHDNGALGPFNVTDLPSGVQGRWQRVWRVSETNAAGGAVNVGNVDITFDMAGLGPVTASDLRLLVDTDQDGVFADETPIAGATAIGGTLYRFSNTNALVDGRRFTLGSIDIGQTPLPIELVEFTAAALDAHTVRLEWVTASELNNDHFIVERSNDANDWLGISTMDAVGNSSVITGYSTIDPNAEGPVCYYRLRQVDVDGTSTLSPIVAVGLEHMQTTAPVVHPNPSNGPFTLVFSAPLEDDPFVRMVDASGRTVPAPFKVLGPDRIVVDPGAVPQGTYVLQVIGTHGPPMHTVRILR
ncbi:MAG: hypothetical protein KDB84_04605 [Flavobacteriales bacterium]|nr:hypothetical protein [Flavobacteriales bacterium]